jgi:hypothetical protein
MTVIENKHTRTKLRFADLPIGYTYRDEDGYLCIKTNHDENDCSTPNCIAFLNGSFWEPNVEGMNKLVTPVEATLTLEE